ncbi:coenzyme PQQ biosynthesis probable peptidase PqqF [Pseudomonas sp. ok272]|uniref:pyrroloquinoline quinone biosynthesis protein PqqF n=1 Tax=unclassified Pseudomonas TaxID=196821 RepID=UPI0008B2E32E|nr:MULTISPECIES: pyrroloquinoline quinone biosynthesis protein PqqF [unclassified Pseudomonas]SEM78100.1 coenzyme PQQ biosynthesis probable peptidase PqqF [Pseudomonas sp. ok272]SFM70267.1 coenzyme PQQ biosynthesis probable peptidase PqqF [Pseudomonas sp. ok602]
MPAPTHLHPHTATLANGLRVALRHAPGLKRCAAVLRVAAGSHDAPHAWPGLAHLVEHLLFLGTPRFPAGDGLMAYVQQHGGQLNASTRERHTDFFFELPPHAFAGGLERLQDMLAQPRLDPDDQRREREVLEAEFIAWSQDASAQQQHALFAGLAADHPLRGVHAGNRDSLKVEQPAFQQALRAFHQRFYHSARMSLSLVGPMPLDELHTLANSFGAAFISKETSAQDTPPALMTGASAHYQQASERRLDLLFTLEALPDASREALDFLCTWVNTTKPGGLLAELRQRHLIEQLKATPLYQFGGQALLHVAFTLTDAAAAAPTITALFHDWLHFFAQQADWSALRAEYALQQQRKRQSSQALTLARLDSESLAPQLPESGVIALKAILQQMAAPPANHLGVAWQLPAANPFLRSAEEPAPAGLIRGQTSAHRGLRTFAQDRTRGRRERSSMQFSQALSDNSGDSVLCLRWCLDAPAPANLAPVLRRSLQSLSDDALQAGVALSFNETGNQWRLTLSGWHEPMPAILEQALHCLASPQAEAWQGGDRATPPIAIRQLLKALPVHCLGQSSAPALGSATLEDLQQRWAGAHWDGLAAGLSATAQSAITRALSRAPGSPDGPFSAPLSIAGCRLWSHVPCTGSEHAVLLFCPAPSLELADEAAWRMLGHICQTPFYQRLRVERQLGYAVFSGIRQINGQTGMLLGVQSPHAPVKELLEHVERFLQQLPELIAALDDATLRLQQHALAQQLDTQAMPLPQAFELLWQGKLAGHSSDYLIELQQAVSRLDRRALLEAASRLIQLDGGRRCLANSPPEGGWQRAD